MSKEITVHVEHTVHVLEAPDEALISIELVAKAASPGFSVAGNMVFIGTGEHLVVYEITGWDIQAKALIVQRCIPTGATT